MFSTLASREKILSNGCSTSIASLSNSYMPAQMFRFDTKGNTTLMCEGWHLQISLRYEMFFWGLSPLVKT